MYTMLLQHLLCVFLRFFGNVRIYHRQSAHGAQRRVKKEQCTFQSSLVSGNDMSFVLLRLTLVREIMYEHPGQFICRKNVSLPLLCSDFSATCCFPSLVPTPRSSKTSFACSFAFSETLGSMYHPSAHGGEKKSQTIQVLFKAALYPPMTLASFFSCCP